LPERPGIATLGADHRSVKTTKTHEPQRSQQVAHMRPVLKTNNPVLLSFAQSLLAEAEIESVVFDENASVMDGSLGILPRRLMVADDDLDRGLAILKEGVASQEAPPVVTSDRFLGGRLTLRQFEHGFRAGLDAVMLAAAVPAGAGDTVLELGSGAGAASLCLAARIAGATITGVEIESELVTLANGNAGANGFEDRAVFVTVDALDLPADMKHDYDHVFCNPPFHGVDGATSPDAMRAGATHDDGALAEWLTVGVKRTAPGGAFTCILRADRMGEALAALPALGVSVFPLFPRAGEAAKRVIIQARKNARAPLAMLAGLVLHEADGSYTARADAVLRGETGIDL
jgi:tRNA1Val (adenine37-N6)-methyltransferase